VCGRLSREVEKAADLADTAALIARLDLVITVDTAVAHLAGALGKPVWIVLHVAADWRWLTERADSPWYPTVRLFRVTPAEWLERCRGGAAGGWEPVLERVSAALRALVGG
jgi:ADP-heptose:LPS heptosyltransferase